MLVAGRLPAFGRLLVVVAMVLGLCVSVAGEAAAGPSVQRTFTDPDPVAASAAMARQAAEREPARRAGVPVRRHVVVARADVASDALSAVTVPGPLLLVAGGPQGTLVDATRQAVQAWSKVPDMVSVVIVGGPAAVSEQIAAGLAGYGLPVERVKGPDRIGTSVAVAQRFATDTENGFLVRARGPVTDPGGTGAWADAVVLAGAGFNSLWLGRAVLATETDHLDPRVAEYLASRRAPRVLVLMGGRAALSDDVEREVRGQMGPESHLLEVGRVSGPHRVATAVSFATVSPVAGRTRFTIVNPWRPGGWAAALVGGRDTRTVLFTNPDGGLDPASLRLVNDCGTGVLDIDVAGPAAHGGANAVAQIDAARRPEGCRDGQPMRIGVRLPQDGDHVEAGARLAVDDIASAGGVHGKPPTLATSWPTYEDGLDAPNTYVDLGGGFDPRLGRPSQSVTCMAWPWVDGAAVEAARAAFQLAGDRHLTALVGWDATGTWHSSTFSTRRVWDTRPPDRDEFPSMREVVDQTLADPARDLVVVGAGSRADEVVAMLLDGGVDATNVIVTEHVYPLEASQSTALGANAAGIRRLSRPRPSPSWTDRLVAASGRDLTDAETLAAAEVYDCIQTIAVAMEASGSTNAYRVVPAISAVVHGGVRCTSPATCLTAARRGENVDLDGPSGLLGDKTTVDVMRRTDGSWAQQSQVLVDRFGNPRFPNTVP